MERFANQPANHGARQCSSWPPSPFSACALSRKAPSTTIFSPARSPESTSTSPPRSRPRPIRRISKGTGVLGKEDTPFVADALHRGDRHGENRFACPPDRQRGRRRHARSQDVSGIAHVNPHRHRSRLALDVPTDDRNRSLEVLSRQRGKCQLGGHALFNPDGVPLEGMHRQPERREVPDTKRWHRRLQHLPDDRGPLDHRAAHGGPQGKCRGGGPVRILGRRCDAERTDGSPGRIAALREPPRRVTPPLEPREAGRSSPPRARVCARARHRRA